jgi:hypothetical protein
MESGVDNRKSEILFSCIVDTGRLVGYLDFIAQEEGETRGNGNNNHR